MGIGDEEPAIIDIVDWHDLYNRTDTDEESIIEGLAFRGRWTAIAAAAKEGKSTVILALAVAAAKAGLIVLYIDAEMGRTDVLDRVANWMHLKPDDLEHVHYCDLPPKLDNVQGATALYNTVDKLNPDLVVIDGLNGVVNGAENDDTTWRDMYEWAISPLKQRNCAVISLDNAGHGDRKGPRGSSVKLDKADAILVLSRTDIGSKIVTTHRRSANYPLEQEYAVHHASEEGPAMTVERIGVGVGYPPGTKELCALLDQLGAPLDISRRKAQTLLRQYDGQGRKNDVIGKALTWRREHAEPPNIGVVPWSPGPVGTTGTSALKVVPNVGDHFEETPARSVVPDGWSIPGTTPVTGSEKLGTTTVPEANPTEYDGDF